jgi:hypothetical protein
MLHVLPHHLLLRLLHLLLLHLGSMALTALRALDVPAARQLMMIKIEWLEKFSHRYRLS